MSLLLDALRRADRERQRGKLPSLSQVSISGRPRPRARWPLVVLLFLAGASAGAAAYFLASRSSGPTHAQPAAKVPAEPAETAEYASAPDEPAASPPPSLPQDMEDVDVVSLDDLMQPPAGDTKPGRESMPSTASPAASAQAAQDAASMQGRADQAPQVSEETGDQARAEEPAPPPLERSTVRVPPAPSTREAPALRALRDMPPAYRADFPDLRIDVHVYLRDKARRFTLVNGRRYVEGERLVEGPQLVEIVPNGLILDFRGQRVLYPVNR